MDAFWAEWTLLTDLSDAAPILMRLIATALFAGMIGWERERGGPTAGLRTHMLVGLGAAVFTLVGVLPVDKPDMANIIKGVAAGVGFLGGGAILKNVENQAVEGLTTAATIWIAAAIGMAAGAGLYLAALATTVIALIVLRPLKAVKQCNDGQNPSDHDS